MKKSFKILFTYILVFVVSFCCINVNATSIPYGWETNGKMIYTTEDGTASVTKDGHVVTLTLNNYNGDGLVENCYGTGVYGVVFNIVLIGNNTITSTSDIGIKLNDPGVVNFTGDGDLTINAKTPISYEGYRDYFYINPSENIYTTVKKTEDSISNVDDSSIKESDEVVNESDTTTSSEKTNYTFILLVALIGYIVISLIMMIVLFTKVNKLKKD